MIEKNVRLCCRNACVLLTGCALSLSAMGCFLLPMPRDGEIEAESAVPVEVGLFEDAIDSLDPVVEEPIRELGDEMEDALRADEDDDQAFDEPIEESGDLNGDGVIDDDDLDLFRSAFGSTGDEEADLAADLDGDGRVTLVDFQILLTLAERQEPE